MRKIYALAVAASAALTLISGAAVSATANAAASDLAGVPSASAFPWHAQLLRDNKFVCGGTISTFGRLMVADYCVPVGTSHKRYKIIFTDALGDRKEASVRQIKRGNGLAILFY